MRIVHVGKYYPPTHGGMERILAELCEGLARRGHDVTAVVATDDGSTELRTEERHGVRVVRLPTRGRAFGQPLLRGLRKTIASLEPNVLHVHAPNPLALALLRPDVVTLHARTVGWRAPIDRFITRLNPDFVRLFSSQNEREAWDLEGEVIPFGLSLPPPISLPRDDKSILFVGRLVSYKGIDVLINAMRSVPRGRLKILGDGPERSRLKQLAFGLEDRIEFLGAAEDQTLIENYSRCALYVQPSTQVSEAFGLATLEAMHFGAPVISTSLASGVRVLNRDQITGLVVRPGDALALAAAINELLDSRELRTRLGVGAREQAAKFSADAMVRSHLDLYQSLVKKKSCQTDMLYGEERLEDRHR